jgi:hypothetical protein
MLLLQFATAGPTLNSQQIACGGGWSEAKLRFCEQCDAKPGHVALAACQPVKMRVPSMFHSLRVQVPYPA